MLMATLLFAMMNVFVKLTPHIPAVEVVFFRSIISLIISLGILRIRNVSPWGKKQNRITLLLRGASGATALVLYFYLVQTIPLATAIILQFLTPIFTAILGMFLVRERVKPVQWLFFALAFLGIVVVQGFDHRLSSEHLIMGIVAAVFSALAYNFIRRINTTENPLVIVLYFPLVTMPITGLYSAFNWVQPVGWDWFYLIIIGVLTQGAQYFMTKSYQLEELSKVSSVNYTGILYALLFGWVLFDEKFDWITYVGMGLVVSGVILNVWYKSRTGNSTASK